MKTSRLLPKLILICVFFPLFSLAQFFDDFSDGDFTMNPTWTGDLTHFTINVQNQLQLNATTAGISHLKCLNVFESDSLEWSFNIQMLFAPSGSNFAQFILKSSDTTFLGNENYFYIQFGENLSNDAVELFYKNDNGITSICRGTNGKIANSFDFNFKVTYHEPGIWKIFIDESKTGDYRLDAIGFMPDTIATKSLGFYLKYTSSNLQKFIFDNIYFGIPVYDTIAPFVKKTTTNEERNIVYLQFSENVSSSTALDKNNYIIDNQYYPDSVFFQGNDKQIIALFYNVPFPNLHQSTIIVSNITDMVGNCMLPHSDTILFRTVVRNDVLITEIMADPTPEILLPPCEYIEIYNRNFEDTLFMKGWKLKMGSSVKNLPDIAIPYHGYIVIVPQSCYENYLKMTHHVYPVSSLGITNDGQEIILLNGKDEVIDYVPFHVNWHSNLLKKDGGWSLEMKDVDKPCLGSENWDSSISNDGGTPAYKNSIDQEVMDDKPPVILKAVVNDIITIHLYFSEPISRMNQESLFHIDQGIRIFKYEILDPTNQVVKIELYDPLEVRKIYTLTIQNFIYDCNGNYTPFGTTVKIAIPEEPVKGDIVITEILTDSYQNTNADYIELLNRSDKVIDVGRMRIGSGNESNPEKLVFISSSGFNLFPNQYVCICKNRDLTYQQYYTPSDALLITTDSLPNFPNTSGVVYLTDYSLNILDQLAYTEEHHSSFLSSTDGVSLEKIDINISSQQISNWTSAVASVGFGTPGYQNSNYRKVHFDDQEFSVNPAIISPDQDGNNDFVELIVRCPDHNSRVTIQVFHLNGHLIKVIANNEVVSQYTLFIWDGTNSSGELVLGGSYIMKYERWQAGGEVRKMKKVVSVIL